MRADFRLEDWTVRPLRDCIERGDEVVHIHPKPMAVLEALAGARGEVVTREELFKQVWPSVIVTDDALTQCIVELRKAFGDSAQKARIIKTIPKVGFCLVPPVIFLGGSEQTDEGRGRPAGRWASKHLAALTGFVIVLVVVLVVSQSWQRDPLGKEETIPPVSIAVLPFADMSESGDQQWFTDGLSEELINMLARVDGLRVTNRTSSFHFREPDKNLPSIADMLGVSHVLEGSVRRDGEQLRVTAQLVDASSGYHLWSEAYDRELANVLVLQQDISRSVVHALMQRLGRSLGAVSGGSGVIDNNAHDAVLMGRHLAARRTLDDVQAAIGQFERAIAIEPDYALAHAELAIGFRILWFVGDGLTLSEARARAAPHAERALSLDPNLAEAHAAMGWLQETSDEQLRHYGQAIRINPSYAIAYIWMGRVLRHEGRYLESFEMFETAVRLDPLSIPSIGNYAWNLIERGRLDDARRETQKFALLDPGLYVRNRAWLDSQSGDYAVFALGLLEASSLGLDRRNTNNFLVDQLAILGLEREARAIREPPYAMTLQMLGKVDEAVSVAKENFAKRPDSLSARSSLGRALAAAGDYEQARPILESVWLENDKRVNRSGVFKEYEALALVAASRATDGDVVAGEVLAALQDYIRRLQEAGVTTTTVQISPDFLQGITTFLSGNPDHGLSLIARAVDDGAFIPPGDAYLQALYDDPGFTPIMVKQRSRQAVEREKFLDVVCNDNPYSEVWQPEAGTCVHFLTGDESG